MTQPGIEPRTTGFLSHIASTATAIIQSATTPEIHKLGKLMHLLLIMTPVYSVTNIGAIGGK